MSSDVDTKEPSKALRRRLRPDEEVKWAVEKDMKTNVLASLGSVIPASIFLALFAVFPAFFAAAALGVWAGAAVFLLIVPGLPLSGVVMAVLNAKYGTVEYAATDDRFIQIQDTLTGSNEESVPIDRVRDAEYDEDLTDKIFGTGDIYIEGTKGDSLYFNDAPDGEHLLSKVREEIHQANTVDERH